MTPENLWPESFAGPEELTPGAILRQQADALASRTRHLVEGEVRTALGSGDTLVHRLYLRAPALDYRVPLVEVSHGPSPYPVEVNWMGQRVKANAGGGEAPIDNEGKLIDVLRKIFTDPSTARTVGDLRAYSLEQGLNYWLVDDGEVVGEARTLAKAEQMAREIVAPDGEIEIRQGGVPVRVVRHAGGRVTVDLIQGASA